MAHVGIDVLVSCAASDPVVFIRVPHCLEIHTSIHQGFGDLSWLLKVKHYLFKMFSSAHDCWVPVMVKVVFWNWETHVTLCVHWVWDRKREKRFSSSPNSISYIYHITLPILLCLNSWRHLLQLTMPVNAAGDADGQTTLSDWRLLLCSIDPSALSSQDQGTGRTK